MFEDAGTSYENWRERFFLLDIDFDEMIDITDANLEEISVAYQDLNQFLVPCRATDGWNLAAWMDTKL